MECITVNNLIKKYNKTKAVDDISFSVEEGKITAILGPNGSGKSTTIKSICNLIVPDSGQIKIFGKANKKSINRIAALFEGTRNLYWRLTPVENLKYFAGLRGLGGKKINAKIDELMDFFNLSDKKNTLVNKLSRGMQQKVAIAMTLVCDTDILILDEPTLGLDVESCIDIKNSLKQISTKLHKTVLLSTHDMNFVEETCDNVIILDNGKIIANDSMNNLMDMFKNMTYEISLNGILTNEKMQFLKNTQYNFYIDNNLDNIDKIEVDILDLEKIYDIIELLKSQNILIKEIKQCYINFERVYLNLTRGGNN
ncbi:ABC transporter ATP-binding protein [Sedimentibacter sp. zth1]|uniref:ABC transporter ATP-binding protein n=1 Tax=Sedimentibacter sp. zth1 TaxID=2816908 RepID=UPI001A934A44|nr:ABC transporter ATP-binding protein [Sedimentibacter sp. zth1]QSX05103.1 ABC transporter ATP-binding protein [Sedimentibacter sp. zth1]